MFTFNDYEYTALKEKVESMIKSYKFELLILKNIKLSKKADGSEYKNLKQAFNIKELEKIAKENGAEWLSLEKEDDYLEIIYSFYNNSRKAHTIYLLNAESMKELIDFIKNRINLVLGYIKREELKLSQLEKMKELVKKFIKNVNDNFKNEYDSFNKLSFNTDEIKKLINNF